MVAQSENFILWYKDPTQERETWKLRYLPNFSGFDCNNPIRTPLTKCMFIPAATIRRDTIIERSFKSNSASRSDGLPQVCPIFNVMFSFFAFLYSFKISLYFLSHGQAVVPFKLGSLCLNCLMATVVPHYIELHILWHLVSLFLFILLRQISLNTLHFPLCTEAATGGVL